MTSRQHISKLAAALFVLVMPDLVYAVNALPDPTRPAYWLQKTEPVFVEQIVQPGQKVQWRVNAIRIAPDDRTAIVNGMLVRVGDRVSTGIVREIKHTSVVVEDNDQTLVLRLLSTKTVKDYSKSTQAERVQ